VHFYPRDDTPGCTPQACGIRDVWGKLERKGAVVLGVSPDSPREHVKFREKYNLPFTLLSDEAHEVAETYGTWVEKTMYGKTYMGMERSTFVIDADGTVAKVMRKVKPADHADDASLLSDQAARALRSNLCHDLSPRRKPHDPFMRDHKMIGR
jgi:peroxiredoxin Q/BCP